MVCNSSAEFPVDVVKAACEFTIDDIEKERKKRLEKLYSKLRKKLSRKWSWKKFKFITVELTDEQLERYVLKQTFFSDVATEYYFAVSAYSKQYDIAWKLMKLAGSTGSKVVVLTAHDYFWIEEGFPNDKKVSL